MNNLDQLKCCTAMCYYLEHIKVDLLHKRPELIRDCADHIGAMMSGYISKGSEYKGNWHKFKMTCYASNEALNELQKPKHWDTKGKNITMEHVVPVNVIGTILIDMYLSNKKSLTSDEILKVLKHLLIPCLLTKGEDKQLSSKYKHSMPDGWTFNPALNNQWARYLVTSSFSNHEKFLFDDIVAIAPPVWMAKPNFPLVPTPPISKPPTLNATAIPIFNCNCSDLSETGLSNNCMEGNF